MRRANEIIIGLALCLGLAVIIIGGAIWVIQ